LGYGFIALIAFTGPDCIQCSYKPYVIVAVICLFIFALCSIGNKFKKWEQVCDLSVSSFLLIIGVEYLGNDLANINTKYVMDRASMIITGVVIAFVTSYLIFPVKGSKRIQQGLKNILAADFGFVVSGVLELYSNSVYQPDSAPLIEGAEFRDIVTERKKVLYASAASVFGKTTQMRSLIDTTQGEIVLKQQEKCKLGFFPSEKYTTIMFCTNQLMYITLTLFYGLQGGATNTTYCHLFSKQIDTIRSRFEKMFVAISTLLETDRAYLDVLAHIQVINTLLEQIENIYRENLDNGVALKYSFDDIQAMSNLWVCSKLYVKKTIHLVDSIMRLYDK